jgi:hypothetical protein
MIKPVIVAIGGHRAWRPPSFRPRQIQSIAELPLYQE